MNIIYAAFEFASYAHRNQVRKYTGEPYINHCLDVAAIVTPYAPSAFVDEMIAAATLHDTVEDCEVPLRLIYTIFGDNVGDLVRDLTDVSKPSDGNRETRKKIDLEHTRNASVHAKTIKLADLISNTSTIVQYDPDFARVYLREKERLLEVLSDGHPDLFQRACDSLMQSVLELKSKNLWK